MLSEIAQPGDHWDVTDSVRRYSLKNRLALNAAWDMLLSADQTIGIVGLHDRPIQAHYDADQHALIWDELPAPAAPQPQEDRWYLELLQSDPPRFQFTREASSPTNLTNLISLPDPLNTERGVRFSFSADDVPLLHQPPVGQASFDLSREAARFAESPGFDELISLPMLRDIELYPHQLKTAKTVLRRFRGRALLCDEVGLGKTIEAGMILLELLMRKLARRC